MTRRSLVRAGWLDSYAANTKIRQSPSMNTNSVLFLKSSKCLSNGGDYVTEGMSGSQQSFVRALTRAA
jgi:hypothetical protein